MGTKEDEELLALMQARQMGRITLHKDEAGERSRREEEQLLNKGNNLEDFFGRFRALIMRLRKAEADKPRRLALDEAVRAEQGDRPITGSWTEASESKTTNCF